VITAESSPLEPRQILAVIVESIRMSGEIVLFEP